MKAFHNMILLLLLLSFFQCSNPEQTGDTTVQEDENKVQEPAALPVQEKVQTVAVTNTEPGQIIEPNQADEPSITINSGKAAPNSTNTKQGVTLSTPDKNDGPTITPSSAPPPPPPIVEEIPESAPEIEAEIVEEMAVIPPPNHALFDALLQKAVSSSGKVNYGVIKSNSADLDAYIRQLAVQTPDGSWSRNSAMAYWINAYNAFTIKLVVDNYPVSSIKDLHGGNPWTVKWIKLADKTYSLDQIENEILRPHYNDARIHFAVNCAAKSCPPLHNRAFTESNLNSTLNRLTRSFINNKSYNSISPKKLVVSQIFNWYAKDFGTLTAFIDQYTDTDIDSDATIEYQEYNWSLNE